MAYLHFDNVLLSLGSLLPGKVLSLGVQPLLKQWQCQLGTDGCSRVVAGHIDELGLQVVQHCSPIFQAFLCLLQLRLDPLEELAVILVAVQLAAYILLSKS